MREIEKLCVYTEMGVDEKQDIKVYQESGLYHFTSDSVLLAKFTQVKANDVVADFCSGSGIIGFYLYGLNSKKIKSLSFFEAQKSLFDMSIESVKLNNLQGKFNGENIKIQDIDNSFCGKFSLITCNPPYMVQGAGIEDKEEHIAMCRTEKYLPLSELIKVASKCLKFGGRINLVHRADRLTDIFSEMEKNGIMPKKLQTVSAKGKKPYLVLVEGVKGGKSSLNILENAIN